MKRLLLVILLVFPFFCSAQKPSELKHSMTSYVNDFANLFKEEQRSELNQIMANFHDTVQMTLVTVSSLEGMDPSEYAVKLGNLWGVGSKSNNGVLILVAPNERKLFTATGGGIQGDLTDMKCSSYFREYAQPRFKEGDYFAGCRDLLNAYVDLLSPSAKEIRKQQEIAQAAENAKMNETVLTILGTMLGLAIVIGIFIYALREMKRAKARKQEEWREAHAKYRDSVWRVQNIRSLINRNPNTSQAKELRKLMNKLQLAEFKKVTIEDVTTKELLQYVTSENLFRDSSDLLVKSLKLYADRVSSAESIIENANTYLSNLEENLNTVKNSLSKRVFDKTDFSDSIKNYVNKSMILKALVADLNSAMTRMDSNEIDGISSKIRPLIHDMEAIMSALTRSINIDNDKIETAKNAKSLISDKLEEFKKQTKKPGTTISSNEKTLQNAKEIESRLHEFNSLDLIGKLLLYSALLGFLTNPENNPSRKEADAYAEAEARKKAEEARIIRQLEEERRRKKEKEEAELRRKRQREDDDYRSRSSYSPSYSSNSSSSSSSDSSSSISFGGGSFDGGGGGGSW